MEYWHSPSAIRCYKFSCQDSSNFFAKSFEILFTFVFCFQIFFVTYILCVWFTQSWRFPCCSEAIDFCFSCTIMQIVYDFNLFNLLQSPLTFRASSLSDSLLSSPVARRYSSVTTICWKCLGLGEQCRPFSGSHFHPQHKIPLLLKS